MIGYVGPGTNTATAANGSSETTNFRYYGSIAASTAIEATGGQIGWTAQSIPALNDCTSGSLWTVTATTNNAEVSFSSATPTLAGCKALTPTFDKIGK